MKKLLQPGNSKLNNTLVFSLPAGKEVCHNRYSSIDSAKLDHILHTCYLEYFL